MFKSKTLNSLVIERLVNTHNCNLEEANEAVYYFNNILEEGREGDIYTLVLNESTPHEQKQASNRQASEDAEKNTQKKNKKNGNGEPSPPEEGSDESTPEKESDESTSEEESGESTPKNGNGKPSGSNNGKNPPTAADTFLRLKNVGRDRVRGVDAEGAGGGEAHAAPDTDGGTSGGSDDSDGGTSGGSGDSGQRARNTDDVLHGGNPGRRRGESGHQPKAEGWGIRQGAREWLKSRIARGELKATEKAEEKRRDAASKRTNREKKQEAGRKERADRVAQGKDWRSMGRKAISAVGRGVSNAAELAKKGVESAGHGVKAVAQGAHKIGGEVATNIKQGLQNRREIKKAENEKKIEATKSGKRSSSFAGRVWRAATGRRDEETSSYSPLKNNPEYEIMSEHLKVDQSGQRDTWQMLMEDIITEKKK